MFAKLISSGSGGGNTPLDIFCGTGGIPWGRCVDLGISPRGKCFLTGALPDPIEP